MATRRQETSRPCRARWLNAAVSALIALAVMLPSMLDAKTFAEDDAEVLQRLGATLSNIADRVKPAVVNISTSKTVKTQRNPFFDDPFFRRFFGEPQAPQKRRMMNLGSGVIASADGYILTNNHVIEGAEDILVRLSDNHEYKGKVVGTDGRTDIAVIKIEENNLPTITWADSDKLKVGEVVLAVGNPFGLSQTITMGIISALGRTGIGITDYEDFIQTDAAINPGNSGGALVNARGHLIGINTAIFSTSGGYQGIGFAIPSNMVKNVMDSIINQGKVVRGWLGVSIQPITAELAKQFGLKDEKGVLLADVIDGGPADKGGLKRGDVILEYDGKKVDSPFTLKNSVASTKPGKEAIIRAVRDGQPLTLTVTVGELPTEENVAEKATLENVLRGVAVQEVTDEILRRLGITKQLRGVVVTGIEEDSPALGTLLKGDIITEINRKPVPTLRDYSNAAARIEKGQAVLLSILRQGSYMYISLPAQ